MENKILLSDFASPTVHAPQSLTLSKIRTLDHQVIKEKSFQLRNQSTGYQILYVDQLDFCVSHAMIDRMGNRFAISKALRELNESKKDDWTLIDEALKNPKRSIHQKILKLSSQSDSYRLRYPYHFRKALQYVTSVLNCGINSTYGGIHQAVARRYTDHISSLCNQSSPFEVYRLYEIYEKDDLVNIKLWEFLALRFGFGDGDYITNSIPEFAARFQFFKEFIQQASSFGDDLCRRIRYASLGPKGT